MYHTSICIFTDYIIKYPVCVETSVPTKISVYELRVYNIYTIHIRKTVEEK